MDQAERQKRIVEYLSVKSVTHGQIYTFQIAIPNPESVEIPTERFEALSHSLTQQGTNLIPLIVRRTEDYSEEEEYEVVYGAEWCLVAKELDIEKLWVWVFDMTDDEASAVSQEMERLIGGAVTPPDDLKQVESLLKQVEGEINKKLEDKLNQQTLNLTEKIENRQQEVERLISGLVAPPDTLKQVELLLKQFEGVISKKLEDELSQQVLNLVERVKTRQHEIERPTGEEISPSGTLKQVESLLKQVEDSINTKLEDKLDQQVSNLIKGIESKLEIKPSTEELQKIVSATLDYIDQKKEGLEALVKKEGLQVRPKPNKRELVEVLIKKKFSI